MDNAPLLLLIAGSSGSGKTTLIEKVIAALISKGIRPGAIKRSHHGVEFDRPGKDSDRFAKAGANPVALVSGRFFAFMETGSDAPTLAEAARFFNGKADIVLVEGYKNEEAPRLCFLEKEGDVERDNDLTKGYITTGGDTNDKEGRPVFDRDESERIADWIAEAIDSRAWR